MKILCWITIFVDFLLLDTLVFEAEGRKSRSVVLNIPTDPLNNEIETNRLDSGKPPMSSTDFIWSRQTVAAGDTAVLHCSFDAIFSQLRNGNIDWVREKSYHNDKDSDSWMSAELVAGGGSVTDSEGQNELEEEDGEEIVHTDGPLLLATGKKVLVKDKRYRVYRPHHSALSVLIIRRAKKRDAGIFKCNLSGSSTRHKYLVLNVTQSKIEAQTSPARLKARIGKDVTLWCNATGYPKPIVYWTREDRNRKLPDGSYQYWGNALSIHEANEGDTGIYACYLDNFVQPIVSYKFSLMVEDRPWEVDAYKMRFDSSRWFSHGGDEPKPVQGKSYLLMCETRGSPTPVPKIRWYRDGRPVRNNRHFYIIEDRPSWRSNYVSSTLVVMRFVPRFQGNYTCVGSNVFRIKQQTFNLIGYIPIGAYRPTNQPYIEGDSDTSNYKFDNKKYDEDDEGSAMGSDEESVEDMRSAHDGPSDDEDYQPAEGSG